MGLWPNSPFARPVGSFVEPVDIPGSDPLSGDCVAIRVNKAWLPYIVGSLQQLLLQTTWKATGDELLAVQQQAMNLIVSLSDPIAVPCEGDFIEHIISESDYQMSICEQLRFNGGVLEGYCCGEWVPIQGQSSQGSPVAQQPGEGAPVPQPNGGSKIYCGGIDGPNQWLLPVPVSSGDTLEFHNLIGAWNDSAEVIWNCPDGWVYALGACGQALPHGSPDPLPTALHMQIIAKIDGNWYDPLQVDIITGSPTLFTIPPGISNANVLLQGNLDDISRQQGNVTFCVTVTNNQQGTFDHTDNLVLAPGKWVIGVTDPVSGVTYPEGQFSPGIGYTDKLWPFGSTPDSIRAIEAIANFDARTITKVEVGFTLTPGSYPSGKNLNVIQLFHAGTMVDSVSFATPSFPTSPWTYTNAGILVDEIAVRIGCGFASSFPVDPGGSADILTIEVAGKGTDPLI